jgi:hypothetical protein
MINYSFRRFRNTVLTIAILTGLLAWWYNRLNKRQKQFIQNMLQQLPDLPARYMV